MEIDAFCDLPKFRHFMIISTCLSFIPQPFLNDEMIFPERTAEEGTMYVEAEDKETLKIIGDIVFVRVSEVLGILYTSKSGRTRLKWRSLGSGLGRLSGDVSSNSLVNLYASGALDESYASLEERNK